MFPTEENQDYLLDLEYKGPSFDGVMEIAALKNEIIGLEEAIKITTKILSRNSKINFSANDIDIYIEAFQKASFRKKVKVVLKAAKSLNNYQGALSLGAVLISAITLIQQNGAVKIQNMSPELMAQIADQTKVELLTDKSFLQSVAGIINPLNTSGDELFCATPNNNTTTVSYHEKQEFSALASNNVDLKELEGDKFETLYGRINRVDLDATKRHIGFKVNGEGNSISATLSDQLRKNINMLDLLGHWVEIDATTTYRNGAREHIEISSLKIINNQNQILFSRGKTDELK